MSSSQWKAEYFFYTVQELFENRTNVRIQGINSKVVGNLRTWLDDLRNVCRKSLASQKVESRVVRPGQGLVRAIESISEGKQGHQQHCGETSCRS